MKIEEKRMIEYQKAQDSAEHYNSMIWTLMAIGIVGSLTILHIFWTNRPEVIYSLLMLFTGAFILAYFSYLIEGAHGKKIKKYSICKEIEKDYGFKGQHIHADILPMFKGGGIKIFRVIKIFLFFLYIISIIFGLGSASIEGKAGSFITSLTQFVVFLIVSVFIILEIYYWKNNN